MIKIKSIRTHNAAEFAVLRTPTVNNTVQSNDKYLAVMETRPKF